MPNAADILLIGPGWLGAPLASALAASRAVGGRVWTLRRTPGAAPEGCLAVVGDVADPAVVGSLRAQGVSAVGHVVVAVAPSRARGDDPAG